MRRTVWISVRRLNAHQFNTTLRVASPNLPWPDKFRKLSELQNSAIQQATKLYGSLIVTYLILAALNGQGTVSITIQGVTASVPTAYYSVMTGFLYLIFTLSLLHLFTIMSLRNNMSGRILIRSFSPNIYGLLHGYDENTLAIPNINNIFLKERTPFIEILSLLLLIAMSGLLIPYLAYGYYLTTVQIELLFSEVSKIEKIAAAITVLMIVYSYAYFFLFNIPLPFKKNTYSIRWGLLAPIADQFPHPRSEQWQDR